MTAKKKKRQKGFTLVELMVVMVILGVLALIAVPIFRKNYESEYNEAIRTLAQNLMRARTLSMSRRENHSIIINGANYYLQAVNPSDSTKLIDPKIRDITLPSSAKISNIKQCADKGTACSGTEGTKAELRFDSTGELLSCVNAAIDGSCTRTLKSVTIFLQGVRPDGVTDADLDKRIIIYMTTGHIKLY